MTNKPQRPTPSLAEQIKDKVPSVLAVGKKCDVPGVGPKNIANAIGDLKKDPEKALTAAKKLLGTKYFDPLTRELNKMGFPPTFLKEHLEQVVKWAEFETKYKDAPDDYGTKNAGQPPWMPPELTEAEWDKSGGLRHWQTSDREEPDYVLEFLEASATPVIDAENDQTIPVREGTVIYYDRRTKLPNAPSPLHFEWNVVFISHTETRDPEEGREEGRDKGDPGPRLKKITVPDSSSWLAHMPEWVLARGLVEKYKDDLDTVKAFLNERGDGWSPASVIQELRLLGKISIAVRKKTGPRELIGLAITEVLHDGPKYGDTSRKAIADTAHALFRSMIGSGNPIATPQPKEQWERAATDKEVLKHSKGVPNVDAKSPEVRAARIVTKFGDFGILDSPTEGMLCFSPTELANEIQHRLADKILKPTSNHRWREFLLDKDLEQKATNLLLQEMRNGNFEGVQGATKGYTNGEPASLAAFELCARLLAVVATEGAEIPSEVAAEFEQVGKAHAEKYASRALIPFNIGIVGGYQWWWLAMRVLKVPEPKESRLTRRFKPFYRTPLEDSGWDNRGVPFATRLHVFAEQQWGDKVASGPPPEHVKYLLIPHGLFESRNEFTLKEALNAGSEVAQLRLATLLDATDGAWTEFLLRAAKVQSDIDDGDGDGDGDKEGAHNQRGRGRRSFAGWLNSLLEMTKLQLVPMVLERPLEEISLLLRSTVLIEAIGLEKNLTNLSPKHWGKLIATGEHNKEAGQRDKKAGVVRYIAKHMHLVPGHLRQRALMLLGNFILPATLRYRNNHWSRRLWESDSQACIDLLQQGAPNERRHSLYISLPYKKKTKQKELDQFISTLNEEPGVQGIRHESFEFGEHQTPPTKSAMKYGIVVELIDTQPADFISQARKHARDVLQSVPETDISWPNYRQDRLWTRMHQELLLGCPPEHMPNLLEHLTAWALESEGRSRVVTTFLTVCIRELPKNATWRRAITLKWELEQACSL